MLLAAEALFVVLVAVGVGMVYLPAGLVVFGLMGIVACEYGATRRRLAAARRTSRGPGE
jgi:hypothetical protein